MIKVEVIENFTLADYKKLKNVKKVIARKENGFGVGDTFECDEEMVDYLTGNNAFKKEVVKIIEVTPKKEIEEETKDEIEAIIEYTNEKVEPKAVIKKTQKKKKTTKKSKE